MNTLKPEDNQIGFMSTSFGIFKINANINGLNKIQYFEKKQKLRIPLKYNNYNNIVKKTIKQLQEYFSGTRITFSIPINLNSSPFYKKVLLQVLEIPYGEKTSYKSIAKICGNQNANRAVGTANSTNPIPIIIPCHRVIPSNNSIGKYRYGIELKKRLLEQEGHSFDDNLFFI